MKPQMSEPTSGMPHRLVLSMPVTLGGAGGAQGPGLDLRVGDEGVRFQVTRVPGLLVLRMPVTLGGGGGTHRPRGP